MASGKVIYRKVAGELREISADIFKEADSLLDDKITVDNLPLDVPRDPQAFYTDFGVLPHPHLKIKKGGNMIPAPAPNLTEYQKAIWSYEGDVLAVKSNKVGLTSSCAMECFHRSILPEYAGTEIIIGAQDQPHANRHLEWLKLRIKQSTKYAPYLIENPQHQLLREMKSKVSFAVIANPYNSMRPTFIIAVGGSEGRAYSWMNVSHILLSDISLLRSKDQSKYWRGIYSRVTNTGGHVKIESVPAGQQGLVWNLYRRIMGIKDEMASGGELEEDEYIAPELLPSFKLFQVHYREALAAGVISQEQIDKARRNMSELEFRATYECEFVPPGNAWYKEGWFTTGNYGI